MEQSNGFKSRKLWYAVGTSAALIMCAVGAAFWPAFGVNFGELIGGLLGCLAIYTGTNIGSKLVQGKTATNKPVQRITALQTAAPAHGQPVEEIEEELTEE